jgi:glycosyltransferase involved in cell wall biosynthesis
MRIGLITGEYPPMQGGVGAFSRELAAALVQQGHDVYILTDRRASRSAESGVEVEGIRGGWNRASLIQTGRWARANRLDVINIQYEAAAFQMAPLVHWLPALLKRTSARRPKVVSHLPARSEGKSCPVVTTFHDLLAPYLFPKAGPLRYRVLLALAGGSDGVIITNRQDEQQLYAERGIVRLRRIPIGSNVRTQTPPDYDRTAWREQLDIPDDAIFVGYFGFLNASKGIETLLKAAAQAIAQGLNVYLLMIGGRTGSSDPTNVAYANQIDALTAQLDITDRVRWTGFADDPEVSGHLSACDMVALPYRDGVSFRRGSFMAAIAHGCAIITTAPQVELPELQDGVNLRLIPADSPDALANAILELAGNRDLRARLRTNARTLAGCFTWDQIAAQTAAFYAEMIG